MSPDVLTFTSGAVEGVAVGGGGGGAVLADWLFQE